MYTVVVSSKIVYYGVTHYLKQFTLWENTYVKDNVRLTSAYETHVHKVILNIQTYKDITYFKTYGVYNLWA